MAAYILDFLFLKLLWKIQANTGALMPSPAAAYAKRSSNNGAHLCHFLPYPCLGTRLELGISWYSMETGFLGLLLPP